MHRNTQTHVHERALTFSPFICMTSALPHFYRFRFANQTWKGIYIYTFSIYRQIAREKKERYQFNQSGIFKEQWYYNCANYGALQKINPKGVLNWHFSNKILDLWVLIQNDVSLKTWGMCEKSLSYMNLISYPQKNIPQSSSFIYLTFLIIIFPPWHTRDTYEAKRGE